MWPNQQQNLNVDRPSIQQAINTQDLVQTIIQTVDGKCLTMHMKRLVGYIPTVGINTNDTTRTPPPPIPHPIPLFTNDF